MSKERKKLGVGFWCAIGVLTALTLYPVTFGPVCWWFSEPPPQSREPGGTPVIYVSRAYWPVGWFANHSPASVRRVIVWYGTFFGSPLIAVPTAPSGDNYAFLAEPSFFR